MISDCVAFNAIDCHPSVSVRVGMNKHLKSNANRGDGANCATRDRLDIAQVLDGGGVRNLFTSGRQSGLQDLEQKNADELLKQRNKSNLMESLEKVPCEILALDPANVRKHSRKNLDAIKASLRRFGQQKPIVVDAKGIVLAGNGTLTAARELGWKDIQIVRSTLEGIDATAFGIADNRSAELAEWDDNLGQILESLCEEINLSEIGFNQEDLEKLIKENQTEEKSKDVEIVSAIEVIVECKNEDEQKTAYELLVQNGYKCRLVTL